MHSLHYIHFLFAEIISRKRIMFVGLPHFKPSSLNWILFKKLTPGHLTLLHPLESVELQIITSTPGTRLNDSICTKLSSVQEFQCHDWNLNELPWIWL